MADEPALDAKYEGLRRGLRSRRRDDHALDLFRRAEANLADVRQVDRILLELGRFYNPLTNRPIVDLATRRSIVERLEAGRLDEARQLLDDCVARYAPPDGPAPPAGRGASSGLRGSSGVGRVAARIDFVVRPP